MVQAGNRQAAKNAATAGVAADAPGAAAYEACNDARPGPSDATDDALGDPGDARTIDQLRADLCADTLLTGAPSGHDTTTGLLAAIQARVEVTVPVFTLMGADTAAGRAPGSDATAGTGFGASGAGFGVRVEQPGELAGGHPID
ncbi:hypothetical protein ACTJJZ_17365, partial [Microbacterium sp. 22242]